MYYRQSFNAICRSVVQNQQIAVKIDHQIRWANCSKIQLAIRAGLQLKATGLQVRHSNCSATLTSPITKKQTMTTTKNVGLCLVMFSWFSVYNKDSTKINHWLTAKVNKELKQLWRRPQRQLHKNNMFNDQNNSSALPSRFLVHFFDVHCTTTTQNLPICDKFSFLFLNLNKILKNSNPWKVACFWHIERVQIDEIKFKRAQIHFLPTFSLLSSSSLLKVPNYGVCRSFSVVFITSRYTVSYFQIINVPSKLWLCCSVEAQFHFL